MRALDLFYMQIGARFVVLSACETALGKENGAGTRHEQVEHSVHGSVLPDFCLWPLSLNGCRKREGWYAGPPQTRKWIVASYGWLLAQSPSRWLPEPDRLGQVVLINTFGGVHVGYGARHLNHPLAGGTWIGILTRVFPNSGKY